MAKKKESNFEDLSSFSSNAEYRKTNKAKKGRHSWVKVLVSIFCVILILAGGGMIYVSQYLLGGLTTTSITKDKDELGIASDVQSDPQIKNIALFGVDSRDNNFQGLSDVIIILTIDEVHNKVKMTSVLRDSRVYIGEKAYTSSGYDKINSAYSIGGPELAIRVLNTNYNMDITDYVTVNFARTAAIVNAFDGVDLELSAEEVEQTNKNLSDLLGEEGDASGITDDDYITEESGLVHLTGNAAVAYARIRSIDSDTYRAGRQQNVLEALAGKLDSISLTEYPTIIRQMCNLCETSLDVTTILGFASFVVGGFTLERLIVPGDYENPEGDIYYDDYEEGSWMWKYDLSVAAQHIHEFIYEGDSSAENS